jgi:hypothetical protein
MKKIFSWPPLAFFYSKGKFCPPYFWITCFCGLAVYMFYARLTQIHDFSDELILGVLGFIVAWVGVYSWRDSRRDGGDHGHD